MKRRRKGRREKRTGAWKARIWQKSWEARLKEPRREGANERADENKSETERSRAKYPSRVCDFQRELGEGGEEDNGEQWAGGGWMVDGAEKSATLLESRLSPRFCAPLSRCLRRAGREREKFKYARSVLRSQCSDSKFLAITRHSRKSLGQLSKIKRGKG